jgi:putative ABC transport system permease protein
VGRPKGNAPSTGGGGFTPYRGATSRLSKSPILHGRSFTEQDDASAPGVVIINEAMARQYWPKGDPLQDRLQIGVGGGPAFADRPRQIVGIVGDTHDGRTQSRPLPHDVHSLSPRCPMRDRAQFPCRAALVGVRTNVDPHTLVKPMSSALREASGGLPVAHIRTME